MSVKIVPITDLRRSAADLVEQVNQQGEPIYVAHRSHARAVLLSYDSYESLMARLRDLESLLTTQEAADQKRPISPSRFAESARPFVQKLLAHNRPLFEELARR
ncbi:MAG: type II toxin-antitoxin system Phd/YefM family antitoxin [Chloroflexi bacterium]|nr:type II toxin-antitoxin system Phd/YefM family antitoxin [Chloroflexota bacterium]